MKKTTTILLIFILSVTLAGCAAPAATPTAAPTSDSLETVTPYNAVVNIADPTLEALLRGAMGLPTGDFTSPLTQSVTRLDFNDTLQGYLAEPTPITDLGGLEAFTNLESLDLSGHAVSDISALAGMTKLTALSLAGNPVADLSPLAGLTNLQVLILSGSQAADYSALANLTNLRVLKLDGSTISDLSPLAELNSLRQLSLANTPTDDFAPLETIYPNLEQIDFIIPSTLVDLGFNMDINNHEAILDIDQTSYAITHDFWGPSSREDNQNIILMTTFLNNGVKASIGYYGGHKVYLCQMGMDGEMLVNYIYDPAKGSPDLNAENHATTEQVIRAAIDITEGEDPLLAPVRYFNDAIKNTFHMTPEKLFALPYEPPTLKNLGFFAVPEEAVYKYEQRGDMDVNLEVHRPEWGEREHDVRFNITLREGYRIVVTYLVAERKFSAGVDDDYQGGASFDYFVDTGEHLDGWCSYPDKTVEEYFIKAFNDPSIEDVYQHSIDLMTQYINNRFGMTVEELYALPTGE